MKTAFITGIGGQDGRILARMLLADGYKVSGTVRGDPRIVYAQRVWQPDCRIWSSDGGYEALFRDERPDEIYNLMGVLPRGNHTAAEVAEGTAWEPLRVLEAACSVPNVRVFQALSCEMFAPDYQIKNEDSPVEPQGTYGQCKAMLHYATKLYRETRGLWVSSGIMFPHDSEERNDRFMSRKVAKAVAAIKLGRQKTLDLGSSDSSRDRGHAEDYCRGMRLALAHEVPETFVFATGRAWSSVEFIQEAFKHVGLNWVNHVTGNVPQLDGGYIGDASKAKRLLGWEPRITFKELVGRMVDHELRIQGAS